MGSCITKRSKRNSFYGSIEDSQETTNASASSAHLFDYEFSQTSGDTKLDEFQHEIDKWLMEAENIFLNVVDIGNLPVELQRLIDVSNTEAGWLKIIQSMINVVGQRQFNGENDHIGPTIIILLLEDSPLPTREQLKDLLKLLEPHFSARIHSPVDQTIIKQRNICTILSFLAEKFPGTNPLAVELLSMKVIKFLEKIIRENHNPLHILFALNCIEKFASTRENRETILKNFNLSKELVELEKFATQYTIGSLYCATPADCLKYQIGFCAQWCLDNIVLKKGRKLSYEKVDYSNLNAILNVKDKTEFIKLSSNGLSARCDTSTFECVRATFPVSTGCYYYEAIILTSGIMQIGWATKATNFRNDEGIGVGDDRNSIAFDGCRSVIWHNTTHYKHGLSRWNTGDVVGCLLDVENRKFIFYLNGKKVEINRKIAQKINLHFSDQPYYAAASLMSYQQVYFNFGQAPFKYPPKKFKFADFNSNAIVDNKDNIKIVPIHVQSRSISVSSRKNMCIICCDRVANVRLKPCNHETICSQCANQVDHLCPFCRNEFTHFEEIKS